MAEELNLDKGENNEEAEQNNSDKAENKEEVEKFNLDKEENNEEEESEDTMIKRTEKINDYQLPHKYIFRICLLGESGVGKTSLLTRFCDDSFKENHNNTIGVDFRLTTLRYKDIISKIHIWDTAGQERYRSLTTSYFRNSNAFIFIYDICNQKSFENVTIWMDLAFEKNKESIFNLLVGNKTDQNEHRQVQQSEAEKLAKERNLYFLESSARTDENVQKIFFYLNYKLIEYFQNNNNYDEDRKLSINSEKTEEISIIRPEDYRCNC